MHPAHILFLVSLIIMAYIAYHMELRHFIHRNKPFEKDQVWVEPFCGVLKDGRAIAIEDIVQTDNADKTEIIVIKINGQKMVFLESALRAYIKEFGLIPVKTRKDGK